jgi:hypothetical protein
VNPSVPAPRQSTDSTEARRVDGRVVRGLRDGQHPVSGQWVVLHRVGPDHAGPLDSTRTSANGGYSFRYHTSGDTTAVYFVSTSFGGVAYFTSPLGGPVVSGDPALLTVFDTTSGPVNLHVGGRHIIVGTAMPNGNRPIGEVYDLENDSTVTAIARDSVTPVFTAHLPAAATNFELNANGELAAGAVHRDGTNVGLLVPISPGIRQFAFTYELPPSAFPLDVPIERPTGVLELLTQEPNTHVQGPLRQVAPVSTEGRTFRRFLGQDLQPSVVIRIEPPRLSNVNREKVYIGVAAVVLAAMTAALLVTARRAFGRAPVRVVAPAAPLKSESLLRSIAELDAEFERAPSPAADARAAYEAKRAALKAELLDTLAAERRRR